jgi:tetratricopeptide (TPR) repeat protein
MVYAQHLSTPGWEQLIDAGRTALTGGNYPDAERAYAGALRLAEAVGSQDIRLARSLAELGNVRAALGDCEGGAKLVSRAVRLYGTLADVPPAESGHAWMNLGRAFYCQSLFANAQHAFEKSLALEESAPAPPSGEIAEILAGLAAVYQMRGNHTAAMQAAGRASAILQALPLTDSRTRALVLNNLGAIYRREGRLAEAEQTLRGALSVLRTIADEHDLSTLYVLTNLAVIAFDQARYQEAVAHFSQVLEIIDRGVALPASEIAKILEGYARCLSKLGRKNDARKMAERARAIRRLHPESDVSAWTTSLSDLTRKQ